MEDFIIDVMDIEKSIERKIVTALRFLFSLNKRFRYNLEDKRQSKVVIGVDYPEGDAPLKIPHICVGGITYSFDMEATLYQNYMEDVIKDGIKIGERRGNQVPFSCQVSCYGERNLSRDLANAALSNLTFVGRDIMGMVDLRIMRADKGNTTPYSQFPNIFVTSVSVTGIIGWIGTVSVIDTDKLNILQKIKIDVDKNLYNGGAS